MRTTKSYILYVFSLAFVMLSLNSCSGGSSNSANSGSNSSSSTEHNAKCDSLQENSSVSSNDNSAIIESSEIPKDSIQSGSEQEANRIYFTIPAPEEVLSYLTNGGLAFNAELMNATSNQKNYVDSRSKSINLGIYFSDVAYTAVFSQAGRSSEYMKTIEELGVDISVFSNSDKHIRQRMSNNISNVDSVSEISKEAYEIIVDYLFNANRQKTYALLCIGAYVESMHLALNYADSYKSYSVTMIKKVVEQKLLFDDIYDLMVSLKGDPDIDLTLVEIETLRRSIDELGFSVSNPKASQNKRGDLLIKSDNKYEYTEESFLKFRAQVETLRNSWTSK